MKMRRNARKSLPIAVICCGLALAACSPDSAGQEPAGGQDDGQGNGEDLVPIVMTDPAGNMNFLPSQIAIDLGYYEDEGLEVELVDIGGTAEKIAALLGGDLQFADVTLNAPIAAALAEDGRCAPAIAPATAEYGSNMVLTPEFMEQAGITADMSLEEKASRLSGARIGTSGPGGGAEELWRYVIELGGLDPDQDTTLTTMSEGGDGGVAAIRAGHIDGYASGAPTVNLSVLEGDADWFIMVSEGELPPTRGLLYTVMSTTQEFIEEEPETVQAVVNAITRAIQFINEDPDTAADTIYEGPTYSEMERELFDSSWETMTPAFPDSILMEPESIRQNFSFFEFEDVPEDEWSCFVDQSFAEEAAEQIEN